MAAPRLGIFRSICSVCWMVCSETTRNSATLLWISAAVIMRSSITCLLRFVFRVLSIFCGLPEPFLQGGVMRLGRTLAFATRQLIDNLCLPSRLVISSVETPSSFQAKIRVFSSIFSIPVSCVFLLGAIFQKCKICLFYESLDVRCSEIYAVLTCLTGGMHGPWQVAP
jgi:hypothetical protein